MNQWLGGPFAPVDQEVTVHDLKVTGTIPGDLDGRLLRVGPNPVDPENPVTYNWFTGNGMVHGVRIRGGQAEWYRNRFVRDDQVARSKGVDPLPGPEQRSWALLTPYHEKACYTAPRIDRDRRYGEHERHRLDVHSGDRRTWSGSRATTTCRRSPASPSTSRRSACRCAASSTE
jgi:Retinal pigment epithelial membrane protein